MKTSKILKCDRQSCRDLSAHRPKWGYIHAALPSSSLCTRQWRELTTLNTVCKPKLREWIVFKYKMTHPLGTIRLPNTSSRIKAFFFLRLNREHDRPLRQQSTCVSACQVTSFLERPRRRNSRCLAHIEWGSRLSLNFFYFFSPGRKDRSFRGQN